MLALITINQVQSELRLFSSYHNLTFSHWGSGVVTSSKQLTIHTDWETTIPQSKVIIRSVERLTVMRLMFLFVTDLSRWRPHSLRASHPPVPWSSVYWERRGGCVVCRVDWLMVILFYTGHHHQPAQLHNTNIKQQQSTSENNFLSRSRAFDIFLKYF